MTKNKPASSSPTIRGLTREQNIPTVAPCFRVLHVHRLDTLQGGISR